MQLRSRKLLSEEEVLPWTALELEFCKTRDYKPAIGTPRKPQIEKAREEYRARFMCEEGKDSGVPGVLVATNVGKKWDDYEAGGSKFYLNANRDLFMLGISSTARALTTPYVVGDCGNWEQKQNMSALIVGGIRCHTRFGPDQEEPDVSWWPMLPWDANATGRPDLE